MTYFVVHALDQAGASEARALNRPAHRARLRGHDHPIRVHVGGPLLDGSGDMCGTLLIVEADAATQVEAFLAGDPYCKAGIYQEVSIHPFNWGLGQPEVKDG